MSESKKPVIRLDVPESPIISDPKRVFNDRIEAAFIRLNSIRADYLKANDYVGYVVSTIFEPGALEEQKREAFYDTVEGIIYAMEELVLEYWDAPTKVRLDNLLFEMELYNELNRIKQRLWEKVNECPCPDVAEPVDPVCDINPPPVGDPWRGGVYVGTRIDFTSGQEHHYIASATSGIRGNLQWETSGTPDVLPSTESGATNTSAINESNLIYPAAQYCINFFSEGCGEVYTDWFMPSRSEIQMLANIPKGNPQSGANLRYWTSNGVEEGGDTQTFELLPIMSRDQAKPIHHNLVAIWWHYYRSLPYFRENIAYKRVVFGKMREVFSFVAIVMEAFDKILDVQEGSYDAEARMEFYWDKFKVNQGYTDYVLQDGYINFDRAYEEFAHDFPYLAANVQGELPDEVFLRNRIAITAAVKEADRLVANASSPTASMMSSVNNAVVAAVNRGLEFESASQPMALSSGVSIGTAKPELVTSSTPVVRPFRRVFSSRLSGAYWIATRDTPNVAGNFSDGLAPVTSVIFNYNKDRVAASTKNKVFIYKYPEWNQVGEITLPGMALNLHFNPVGDRLFVGTNAGNMRVFETTNWTEVAANTEALTSVASGAFAGMSIHPSNGDAAILSYSPNADVVIAKYDNPTLVTGSVGQFITGFDPNSLGIGAAYSHNGQYLAVVGSNTERVVFLDVANGYAKSHAVPSGITGRITSLSYTDDDAYLFVTMSGGDEAFKALDTATNTWAPVLYPVSASSQQAKSNEGFVGVVTANPEEPVVIYNLSSWAREAVQELPPDWGPGGKGGGLSIMAAPDTSFIMGYSGGRGIERLVRLVYSVSGVFVQASASGHPGVKENFYIDGDGNKVPSLSGAILPVANLSPTLNLVSEGHEFRYVGYKGLSLAACFTHVVKDPTTKEVVAVNGGLKINSEFNPDYGPVPFSADDLWGEGNQDVEATTWQSFSNSGHPVYIHCDMRDSSDSYTIQEPDENLIYSELGFTIEFGSGPPATVTKVSEISSEFLNEDGKYDVVYIVVKEATNEVTHISRRLMTSESSYGVTHGSDLYMFGLKLPMYSEFFTQSKYNVHRCKFTDHNVRWGYDNGIPGVWLPHKYRWMRKSGNTGYIPSVAYAVQDLNFWVSSSPDYNYAKQNGINLKVDHQQDLQSSPGTEGVLIHDISSDGRKAAIVSVDASYGMSYGAIPSMEGFSVSELIFDVDTDQNGEVVSASRSFVSRRVAYDDYIETPEGVVKTFIAAYYDDDDNYKEYTANFSSYSEQVGVKPNINIESRSFTLDNEYHSFGFELGCYYSTLPDYSDRKIAEDDPNNWVGYCTDSEIINTDHVFFRHLNTGRLIQGDVDLFWDFEVNSFFMSYHDIVNDDSSERPRGTNSGFEERHLELVCNKVVQMCSYAGVWDESRFNGASDCSQLEVVARGACLTPHGVSKEAVIPPFYKGFAMYGGYSNQDLTYTRPFATYNSYTKQLVCNQHYPVSFFGAPEDFSEGVELTTHAQPLTEPDPMVLYSKAPPILRPSQLA